MTRGMRDFCLALIFLSRIPVPLALEPSSEDWGRSVFFFPFVGLVIGLLMVALDAVLRHADPGVLAVLSLALWVLITGGLHLDGLADAADAWIGGFADREKSLAIMKDPRSGPIAIVVVVLVLLSKFAALRVIVEQNAWGVLLWTPVLGRAAILMMLLTTPYVRPEGVGIAHADHLPRLAVKRLLWGIAAVTIWGLGWRSLVLLSFLGMSFLALRRLLLARIGGTTGDTLGATCELSETTALLVLTLLLPHPA